MLEKLRRNYPNAEIWCFTLAISRYLEGFGYEGMCSRGGKNIEQFCITIESVAKRFGCRIIDLYHGNRYETLDGFHPNAYGMEVLAENVLKELFRA